MPEPLWSQPKRVRGIWWVSELLAPGGRVRCKVFVSPKGEVEIFGGDAMFPGAAQAIHCCFAAAQRPVPFVPA